MHSCLAKDTHKDIYGQMHLVDQAKIFVKAGDGGPGCISFRRERYVPKGGPDGGDGGRGGCVIFRVDSGLNTLFPFRRTRRFIAPRGQAGQGKNRHGKSGTDLIVKVPPGTVVKDAESKVMLADLTDPGQEWLAAKGGLGGRGNARFVSATNQAPRYAQPGTKGQERWLELELKLIADVGLIGPPNAGKSTLLARTSAARPRIADYPFTTLEPHLGVVQLPDERTMVLADIPGLLAGAHRGVGMGLDFLKHIERTQVLLFMVDASSEPDEVMATLETIMNEVFLYRKGLMKKPRVIGLNKMDMADKKDIERIVRLLEKRYTHVFPISALTGAGVPALMERLHHLVMEHRSRCQSLETNGHQPSL